MTVIQNNASCHRARVRCCGPARRVRTNAPDRPSSLRHGIFVPTIGDSQVVSSTPFHEALVWAFPWAPFELGISKVGRVRLCRLQNNPTSKFPPILIGAASFQARHPLNSRSWHLFSSTPVILSYWLLGRPELFASRALIGGGIGGRLDRSFVVAAYGCWSCTS